MTFHNQYSPSCRILHQSTYTGIGTRLFHTFRHILEHREIEMFGAGLAVGSVSCTH